MPDQNNSKKPQPFWKWLLKTTGTALLYAGGYYSTQLLQLFPEHTVANQIALPAGFAISFIFQQWLKMKKDYQNDLLPEAHTKIMDKLPDEKKIAGINVGTGAKGSLAMKPKAQDIKIPMPPQKKE